MSGEREVQKVNGTLHCVWLAGMRGQSPACRRFYCTHEKREREKKSAEQCQTTRRHTDWLTQKWAEIILGSSLKSCWYSRRCNMTLMSPVFPPLTQFVLQNQFSFCWSKVWHCKWHYVDRQVFSSTQPLPDTENLCLCIPPHPLLSEGLFTVDQRLPEHWK